MEKRSEDKRMKKGEWESTYEIMLFFILYLVFAIIWYYPFRNGILAGDDLGIPYSFNTTKNIFEMIFGAASKYRPVANLAWLISYKIFNVNYLGYLCALVTLHAISTTSVYWIVKKNTEKRIYGIFMALIFESSFLAYYGVISITGLVESICTFLLIWILYFIIEFYKSKSNQYIWCVIVLLTLIVFTHERFLVLAPIVSIVYWVYSDDKKIKKILMSLVILLPDIFNIFLKKVILKSAVMVGTGWAAIEINVKQIMLFVLESIEILFGINNGPQYLNGYSFDSSSIINKIACFIVAFCLLFIIMYYITQNLKKHQWCEFIKFGIAILWVGVLMISYCLTIRVEVRWVYAPYIVFMTYIIYMIYRINMNKYFKFGILVLLTGLLLFTNYNCRKYPDELYYVKSMKNVQQIYDLTVKEYGESITEYPIYLLEDSEVYWAVGGSIGGSTAQTTAQALNQFIDGEVTVEWKSSLDELEQVKENEEKYIILLRDENNNYYSIVKDGE